ncbi:2004_t:CDS:2, partial [Diversispora eburnea]
ISEGYSNEDNISSNVIYYKNLEKYVALKSLRSANNVDEI